MQLELGLVGLYKYMLSDRRERDKALPSLSLHQALHFIYPFPFSGWSMPTMRLFVMKITIDTLCKMCSKTGGVKVSKRVRVYRSDI